MKKNLLQSSSCFSCNISFFLVLKVRSKCYKKHPIQYTYNISLNTTKSRLCYNGDFHDESEDTHWGEYVKVAFNYINSNYPTPWDEDTERLVAFLFGIISHQVAIQILHSSPFKVADINWHSLQGLHDGYLDVLSKFHL